MDGSRLFLMQILGTFKKNKKTTTLNHEAYQYVRVSVFGFLSVRQIDNYRPAKFFICKFGQVFTNVGTFFNICRSRENILFFRLVIPFFYICLKKIPKVWPHINWQYSWTQCTNVTKFRLYTHISSKWLCKNIILCLLMSTNGLKKIKNFSSPSLNTFQCPFPFLWHSHLSILKYKSQKRGHKYIVLFLKKRLNHFLRQLGSTKSYILDDYVACAVCLFWVLSSLQTD